MPADRFLHKKAGHSRKVTMLTDLEYRVWTQYILSADDFGIMRASAAVLKSDNDHLENRPVKVLEKCLEALIKSTLVRTYEHQWRQYVFQHDWQDFQKVTWPAKTINPLPPSDLIETCSPATQLLFSVHPGARKVPSKFSESTSEVLQKNSMKTSEDLSPRGKGLMANGLGLVASEEKEERLDLAFVAFQAAYPGIRRKGGYLAQQAFISAACSAGGSARLMSALANHLVSEQWSNPKMIPGMDVWLREERWRQELPAAGAVTASANNPKTAGNVAALQRFIDRGRPA